MDNRAINFAAKKHRDQKYGKEPFLAHAIQVHSILSQVTQDEPLLQAALLHDTLEDTPTSFPELVRAFGPEVAKLVREVTKTGYNRFPELKTRRAIMLKFADRLANLSHMESWTQADMDKYIKKSKFWKP